MENKRMERQLKENEEKYRTLFEKANTAILLADTGTEKILDANNAAELLLGRTKEELIGMDRREIHPPEEAEYYKAHFRDHIKQGTVNLADAIVVKKDGTRVPVKISAAVVKINGKKAILGIFTDITVPRRLEEALKASEGKYRALVETTGTGFLILDREGRVVDANPEYVRLSGRRELSEILGRKVTGWTAPYERKKSAKALAGCLRNGFIRDLVVNYTGRGGRETTVEINATAEGKGKSARIISLCRDITKRTRAEETSLKQGALLKAQQEASPDGILVVDEAGRILSYNRRFLDMWGIAPDVIAFRSDKRALQAVLDKLVDPLGFLKRVQYLYKHNKETSHEDIHLKDGRVFERYSSPVSGKAGEYYGRVWCFHDITKRKRLENILKENEATLRAIFDTIKDAIFIKDLEGRFTKVNKACAEIFLMTPDEMMGKTDAQISPPDVAYKMRKTDQEVVRTGKTIIQSYERAAPSGKYHLNTVKTPLRNTRNEITGILGVARDITKLKKMESELALAKALEAVSRKTRPIAHDFNNALAAISGYATLINEDLDAKNPIKPEVAMIIKGVQRAAKITTKLQKYVRNPKIYQ